MPAEPHCLDRIADEIAAVANELEDADTSPDPDPLRELDARSKAHLIESLRGCDCELRTMAMDARCTPDG